MFRLKNANSHNVIFFYNLISYKADDILLLIYRSMCSTYRVVRKSKNYYGHRVVEQKARAQLNAAI